METPDIMLGQQDGTGLGPLLVGALMNAVALYSIGISTAGPPLCQHVWQGQQELRWPSQWAKPKIAEYCRF